MPCKLQVNSKVTPPPSVQNIYRKVSGYLHTHVFFSLDAQESVDFLQHIITKVDTPESKDVYVLAVMEAAHFQLMLGQADQVKKVIDSSEKILDGFDSVETAISASFYRVSAEYFKAEADYVHYYKNALLFLACVNLDDMPTSERMERAYDLAMAALLGDSIYNFGELVRG